MSRTAFPLSAYRHCSAPKEAAVEVPTVEAPKEAAVEVPTVEASVAEENQINYVKQSVTDPEWQSGL